MCMRWHWEALRLVRAGPKISLTLGRNLGLRKRDLDERFISGACFGNSASFILAAFPKRLVVCPSSHI